MRLNKKKITRDSVEAYVCICMDAACSCNCSCNCDCSGEGTFSQAKKNSVGITDSNVSYNTVDNAHNPALANQAVM